MNSVKLPRTHATTLHLLCSFSTADKCTGVSCSSYISSSAKLSTSVNPIEKKTKNVKVLEKLPILKVLVVMFAISCSNLSFFVQVSYAYIHIQITDRYKVSTVNRSQAICKSSVELYCLQLKNISFLKVFRHFFMQALYLIYY